MLQCKIYRPRWVILLDETRLLAVSFPNVRCSWGTTMADNTSTSKTDVENWRRGYEAALAGRAFLRAHGEKTSAWRLGYRDGRALRLKQHAEAKQLDDWPIH